MEDKSHKHLRELQKAINASIDGYIDASLNDAHNRGRIAEMQSSIQDQAERIRAEVVPPVTRVLELGWGPVVSLGARTAVDLDLFNLVSDQEVGLDELAAKTGADRNIVLRMLRMLAASHIITETSKETYKATPFSKALTVKENRDFMKTTFDSMHPILLHAPAFLRKNGFKDQTQTSNACLDLHGANFFEYLARDPQEMATFQSAMAIQESLPPETIPQYPFSDSFDEISPDSVHIIDIGGGRGFFLQDLLTKHPSIPGRLILQEYASVIFDAKSSNHMHPQIELMPHDATHPQPIHGAKYYYFRRVFHTWPDAVAIAALKALRPAMKKGYSKLLIQDEVIPDVGCEAQKAIQDLNMMVVAAMERSEGQWKALLREGGFEIGRIVRAEVGVLGIIEAEVRD